MTGRTLLHYNVVEKLGEGGMGVVWKAHDTHLDRFVALKVLPAEKLKDTERRRRFTQEAKSASALNHPNIIHVYDIAEADGVPFIVMEYVAGKTLGAWIGRKGLKIGDVLKLSVQIADAVAAAHAAGIVHRDLKPSNVMVTENGVAKVLDFGLAKLTERASGDQDAVETQAMEEKPKTEEGLIVGTVAYMSPEQAEGKVVDARSDIFSFGALLYEMVTSRRAFQRDSKLSTLTAILKDQPTAASTIKPDLPHDLETILNRCLRKDPNRRFQHMADVKIALEELKEQSDSGTLPLPGQVGSTKPKQRLVWAGLAGLLVLAGIGVWFGRSKTGPPEVSLVAVPLTTYPGTEDTPSFSPDGTQVAFSWCPENSDKNCHIYIKQLGVEPPSRLTDHPSADYSPAWSPDGQTIGFVRSLTPTRSALILIPQRGGRERVLDVLDKSGQREPLDVPYLAWTPDSRWIVCPVMTEQKVFALFLISVETGEKRRLTGPQADTAIGDTAPAFSADGRTLAFTRQNLSGVVDLYLLHLASGYQPQGEPERVALANERNFGASWMPDGRELVFSSGNWFSAGLWRISAQKPVAPRRLAFAADNATAPSVSQQGNRLSYVVSKFDTDIWRVTLPAPGGKPVSPTRLIGSTKLEFYPSYSPDGKRIAFVSYRSGASEIWVCDADGSNLTRLTSSGDADQPRWSPDGEIIAFASGTGGKREISAISANGGKTRRLISHPAQGQWPYWSRNGEWLYFTSINKGRYDISKMPSKGGQAVQITRNGGDRPEESPDGKMIYYSKGFPNEVSLWRVPASGGEEVKVLDVVHREGQWTVGRLGIFFFSLPDTLGHSDVRVYEFATGKIKTLLTIERQIFASIAVSPDGRTILYPQIEEAGSDLMLVENFR